jgi:outer membrane protein OmpA-like peptidoglycan-associated protein
MKHFRLTSLAGMAAGVAILLASTGCCQQEKKLNQELSQRLGDAREANKKLRQDLEEVESQAGTLRNQLNAKDMTIASLRGEVQRLQQRLGEQGPTSPGEWEKGLVGDRVTLASDILFPAGRAKLTAKGKTSLNKIVADLKSTYAGRPVRVYGYTDTDPIRKTKHLWSDNLDLSLNRAAEVTRYLRSQGIDAKNIETIGMGEQFPLSSKAKSRRVEIIVIKE